DRRPRRPPHGDAGRHRRPRLARGRGSCRHGGGRRLVPGLRRRPVRPGPRPMIVAIDGPAGAGKSTVARGVAAALGFAYLDTGALYRAVAYAALLRREHPAEIAAGLDIEIGDRLVVDGEDVTEAIRAPEVSEAASKAATLP